MKTEQPKKRLKELTIADMQKRAYEEAAESFFDASLELLVRFEARQDILAEFPEARVDNGPLIKGFLDFREAGQYLLECSR